MEIDNLFGKLIWSLVQKREKRDFKFFLNVKYLLKKNSDKVSFLKLMNHNCFLVLEQPKCPFSLNNLIRKRLQTFL